LGQVQPRGSACDSAVIGDSDKGPQLAELHVDTFPNFIDYNAINELDTTSATDLCVRSNVGRAPF
jgi:hypothetical protein